MAGMQGRDNKKRKPWQYFLLLALFLVVWFAPQVYELRDADLQSTRIALAPIQVWRNAERSCLIYPIQIYTTGSPMVNISKHPDSEWFYVKSIGCSGVARVGSGR